MGVEETEKREQSTIHPSIDNIDDGIRNSMQICGVRLMDIYERERKRVEFEIDGVFVDYFGELGEDGRPHGNGVSILSDGSVWICRYEKGVPNGEGKVFYSDGGYFDGELENGKIVRGSLVRKGEKYTGGFLDSEKHGVGEVVHADGGRTVATWANGRLTGKIVMVGVDGKMITMFV